MAKINDDGDLELELTEMASLFDSVQTPGWPKTEICPGCGTMLPMWQWAKDAGHGCDQCKDKPSLEDHGVKCP